MRDAEVELSAVRSELDKLLAGMAALRSRMEQLAALRADEAADAARITWLERVLDIDRVVEHLRRAVERAEFVADPVPRLLISDLLPADVYQALIEAIPPRVFFDGRVEQGQEMRIPPRLAPTPSIVTWMFVDAVGRVLSDCLVARLAEPLGAYARAQFSSLPPFREWGVEVTVIERRLVRRAPGFARRPATDRAWHLVTGIVPLARPQDGGQYGSTLHGTAIPFRANSAVALVGAPETLAYAPVPADAPADTERYTYEFVVGPSRDGRRALAARMGGAA